MVKVFTLPPLLCQAPVMPLGLQFDLNDWTKVFIGGLFWPSLTFIVLAVRFFLRLLFDDDVMIGEWYIYHYSRAEGKVSFIEQKLDISRGFRRKYKVKLLSLNNVQLYKGYLKQEDGHNNLVLNSVKVNDLETIFIRTKRLYHRKNYKVLAAYTGVNFDGSIYTTGCIICDNRLSELNFQQLLIKRFSLIPDKVMIELS